MRKTICDVCGKEITTTNPYEFRLGRKIEIRGTLGNGTINGYSVICQDVCDDCAMCVMIAPILFITILKVYKRRIINEKVYDSRDRTTLSLCRGR